MITNIRKESKGQQTTEIVEQISTILQGIRFGRNKLFSRGWQADRITGRYWN